MIFFAGRRILDSKLATFLRKVWILMRIIGTGSDYEILFMVIGVLFLVVLTKELLQALGGVDQCDAAQQPLAEVVRKISGIILVQMLAGICTLIVMAVRVWLHGPFFLYN